MAEGDAAGGASSGGGCPMAGGGSARQAAAWKRRLDDPLYYGDYLGLDKVLDAQFPKTRELGEEAHDEHLFIVIHQAYELWFKQILHEVGSVIDIMSHPVVPEREIGIVVSRLQRVVQILRLLYDQMGILETMTPMGFLEFRDVLFPASGFQSVQFRVLENKLGLDPKVRLQYGRRAYSTFLKPEDQAKVAASEAGPSLHDLIQAWLERSPFVNMSDFSFWEHYQRGVATHIAEDRRTLQALAAADTQAPREQGPHAAADAMAHEEELTELEQHFSSVFDEEQHTALQASGQRRLSYGAMQAALLIFLHQDEPVLQLPFKLLTTLVDIDEMLTAWRHRHALMVHRMLGVKMGTGGSSGYAYLRRAASKHQVFVDLFNLSTFLIPRHILPPLPQEVRVRLGFSLETGRSPASMPEQRRAVRAGGSPGAGAPANDLPAK